jgi:FkbM family methyltransferase
MRIIFYDSFIASLMSGASVLRSFGNKVYTHAFPIYRPLYAGYKAYADRAERRLLRRILVPGAVAVDAGANIGIYSRFLACCVGPAGAVHSFEPASENFNRLRASTRRFSNVHVVQAAVGQRSGCSELYLSDTLNVDHRTYFTDKSARRMVHIEMVALDDYFKPGQRVDLIKMDIQGYEFHALLGGRRVLRENSEINVLLEFWPFGLKQAGVRWEELIQMLQSLSMKLTRVTTYGLIPFDAHDVRNDISWYVNLFAHRRRG